MSLKKRDIKFNLSGADVRLLQFELGLLGFKIPDEEAADNHFGKGTREAVLSFQKQFDLKVDGIVGSDTAKQIKAQVSEHVPADKSLEQLAQSVKRLLKQIDVLDPMADDLRTQIKQFSETLEAFMLALDTLRQLNAPKAQADQIEEILITGQQQLIKLASSLDDKLEEVKERSSIVSGKLQREDGLSLTGVQVRASHETKRGSIRLGEDTTDGKGHYTIRYQTLPGMAAINLRVSASGKGGKLLQSSDLVQNASPQEVIDLIMPMAEKQPAEQRIEGTIVLEYGLPADNLKLRLYRHDFGGKVTLLDETTTLEGGQYAFTYDSDGKSPSLEVRAINNAGEEIPLSKSLNAVSREPRAALNLVAPAQLKPLAAEYHRLADDLTPHVGKMATLAEAKENDEQQDLTVLNRATGWDARLIALAALTERLSADPEVALPTEAVYGLLRAGLPSDKLLLAQVEPDVAEKALKTVRDAGIVEFTDTQIKTFKVGFTTFSNAMRLNIPVPGSRSTYGDLLKTSGLSQDAQDKFASVYHQHRGDADQLWEKTREAGLDEAQISKLKLQGKFAFLAGNSAAMTARLLRENTDDPAKLVDQNFHRAEEWVTEVLMQAGVPESRRNSLTDTDKQKLDELIPVAYAADSIEDRLQAYTEDMARKIRLSYPTQVVVRLLEKDDNFKPLVNPATVTLLKNATAQGFRFGETPVTNFLKTNARITEDINDADLQTAQRELRQLQRVYQITPSNEAMPVLYRLGMTSAYDVTAYSEAEFTSQYLAISGETSSKMTASLIYRKAKQVNSITSNLVTIARKMDRQPLVAGISASKEVRENVRSELIRHIPTMESLFGSMDFCECEHCRSVLSPAAYLVDLLQFVDLNSGDESNVWSNFLAQWKKTHGEDYPHQSEESGNAMTPYDVLIERRPDLPHISLTCENTHTALPYIDVVNEILEYYVANKNKLSAEAAHDTGEATTEELLAEPQNVIYKAYEKLEKECYPLNLPFDRSLESVRQFCNFFETPLSQVLDAFRTSDALFEPTQPFDLAAVFMESLGLSPAETALFTDPEPLDTWYKLYGFDDHNLAEATTQAKDATGQRIDLNSAKALSRRLGVTYKEITEIVQTGFVNPKLTELALLYKLGVSIGDARLYITYKQLLGQESASLSVEEQQHQDAIADKLKAFAETFDLTMAGLDDELQEIPFDEVLVLADTDAGCNFDLTTLQYADGTKAQPINFLRINLFVRLWRKLGWSIEETDRALTIFIPSSAPFDENPSNLKKQPLKTALIYLAHLKTLNKKVQVGKHSLLKLPMLWSDITTTGKNPLYAQLFLTRSVLESAPVFDDPLGQYLTDSVIKLKEHVLAVQGALGLTADEITRILEDNDQTLDSAELSLPTLSMLYRYNLLANTLKLTMRELIALKQLSGLDPFKPLHPDPLTTIEEDHPFSQTLRFVEVVEEIKDSGLKIEDLDYLLRHHFDDTGIYHTDQEARMALLKTLAEGVRAIYAEHALPDDLGALSDELLRQKLGLILPADVVERFLAMMNATVEFTATKQGVAPTDQLTAEMFTGQPAIRNVHYNATRQEQKLTFRGVLFDSQKAELETIVQTTVFADLLKDVQQQARSFFEKYLQKQDSEVQPAYGFLEAADFDNLFSPPPQTRDDLTVEEKADARKQKEEHRKSNLTVLGKAFFPFLQQRLIRQFIVQMLTAHTGAEPALVESLVTDERLLAVAGSGPLLTSFTATGQRGVSVTFFDSDDLSGAAQAITAVVPSIDTTLKDTWDATGNAARSANSAHFEGYLEVPTPGAYRFYIELDKQGAEAELGFNHLPNPSFLKGTKTDDDTTLSEFIELKPGVLYRFSLKLKNLGGSGARLLVQGETLPKDNLSQLTLYPLTAVASVESALLLLTKALQLVQSLGLSEREIRYIVTHAHDFDGDFDGVEDLSGLLTPPVDGINIGIDRAQITKRFTHFLRLAAYARLKRNLAGGTDDLIGIFEAKDFKADVTETTDTEKPSSASSLIARLTRHDNATVESAAEDLFTTPDFTAPNFKSEKPLWRLWDVLQIVERFGVSVASLLSWTHIVSADATPDQRFNIARDLKEAIKARYEPEAWQRVAQPIFNVLRQRQRDALVSYVMHQNSFDRLEQLYEYFLIDPGMEPVVQTSRIRLATASVQLFIQRCLLNLEPKVHPSTINSKHWAWMKRYRVWEANRKIFLYPENWLEPEFRDDKTHLFNELEGALLQGDVSSDLVEDAFLNYLKKMDELARLDIVAMHKEEGSDPTGILHVFGRTYSLPHKYFYRRYSNQMWTPWEPVSAEIEGDHLAPVVWRDRLYLFWVTFMDKPAEDSAPTGSITAFSSSTVTETNNDGSASATVTKTNSTSKELKDFKIADLKLGDTIRGLRSMVKNKVVDIQLHWSEYLKGEWSTRESGGFSDVISKKVKSDFEPSSVSIHVTKENKDGEERGVYISLRGEVRKAFYLAGRNSLPEVTDTLDTLLNLPMHFFNAVDVQSTRFSGRNLLAFTPLDNISITLLGKSSAYTLLPCNNGVILESRVLLSNLKDLWTESSYDILTNISMSIRNIFIDSELSKPVFYQNNIDTLFVERIVTEPTVESTIDWIDKLTLDIQPQTEVIRKIPDMSRYNTDFGPGNIDSFPESVHILQSNPATVSTLHKVELDGRQIGILGLADAGGFRSNR